MAIDWTPDRVKTLMALWAEGISTLEIGRRLGVTKNAVVGKVHRLGLAKRGSPIKAKPTPPKEIIRMSELRPGMCLWPIGDPGDEDFRFCGGEIIEGKPYCLEHCQKAYVRPSKDDRRDRQRRAAMGRTG